MKQIERILDEIHRLKNELEGYSAQEVLDYIESYINIISREQPSSSDLDEAAEEWCKTNNKGVALCGDGKSHYLADGVDAFKAGAEWMARQGDTLLGIITKVGDKLDVETMEYLIPEESEFERGEHVTVQIRKIELKEDKQ